MFWGTSNRLLAIRVAGTALDPCPLGFGCLQVIRGSHLSGVVLFGPTSADEPTLTPEQMLEFAPDAERVELVMEPGEAVLLHNTLLHKSDLRKAEASVQHMADLAQAGHRALRDGIPGLPAEPERGTTGKERPPRSHASRPSDAPGITEAVIEDEMPMYSTKAFCN